MYEWVLLGFARHALFFFSDSWRLLCVIESDIWFTTKCHFQLWKSVSTTPRRIPLRVSTSPSYALEFYVSICTELLEFCLVQLKIVCFMNLLRDLLTQLLSLCDSFACTSRLCSSSFDQLRLSHAIGSKFHICNFDRDFPRLTPNVEAFTTPNISECYF